MYWRQCEFYDIPYLDVRDYEIDLFLLSLLPFDDWCSLVCIPIDFFNKTITIAAVEPTQLLLDKFQNILGYKVLFFRSTKEAIEEVLHEIKSKKPERRIIDECY